MADKDTVEFLMELKRYKEQRFTTKANNEDIKRSGTLGDLEGAKKGLGTMLRRRAGRCERAQ